VIILKCTTSITMTIRDNIRMASRMNRRETAKVPLHERSSAFFEGD
jgi:hypothetical protein